MTSRQRLAVIGLGMAIEPHLKSLSDLRERVEIAGAWSRSAQRRASVAEKFQLSVTDDLDQLIDDRSIASVLIATPPDARLDLVRRCADAGKHILMEKPIERTTDAAREIVELCETAGVKLAIVFQHRFRPAAVRLRSVLASGQIGELAAASIRVPWWRPQSYYDQPGRGTIARDGGGVLITQAIHTLDLALSLLGPVASVAAIAGTTSVHRMESEDFVGAGLVLRSGALGSLSATTAFYPGEAESIEVMGMAGSAKLVAGQLTVQTMDGKVEGFGEPSATGGGADPMAFPHDWHRDLIADFLDCLEQDRPPSTDARDVLHVHALIDALQRSATERRTIEVAAR